MHHSSEQNNNRARRSEERPQNVPREVILRISRRDDVAPRGGARGHADEGIGGTSRRGGGGDGEVDPPQLVGAGDGDLSANDPSGSGGSHGCLAVAVGAGGGRGKKGFGESGFWAAMWRLVGAGLLYTYPRMVKPYIFRTHENPTKNDPFNIQLKKCWINIFRNIKPQHFSKKLNKHFHIFSTFFKKNRRPLLWHQQRRSSDGPSLRRERVVRWRREAAMGQPATELQHRDGASTPSKRSSAGADRCASGGARKCDRWWRGPARRIGRGHTLTGRRREGAHVGGMGSDGLGRERMGLQC
jgi:hypothetical protein